MSIQKRKWSEAQKLQIIQEVESEGLTPTLRKYNLSQSLYHKWRKKFDSEGIAGLKPKYKTANTEVRVLENEVKQLRQLVGKLSLELEFKTELLKKNN